MIRVYAWLIDLIYRRKNCPTGMTSGRVQKVAQQNGIIQYWKVEKKTKILLVRVPVDVLFLSPLIKQPISVG